jgi:N-dimethylarginine dimethylaminohydrolase
MVTRLVRALVCAPRIAGWDVPAKTQAWRQLGFTHAPNYSVAQAQHDELCRQLQAAEAEVIPLPASATLSLDAVFTHDASFMTEDGIIILNPGKANRIAEAAAHRQFAKGLGIAIAGEITSPGTAEAGDMVWLDSKTLLIGRGFRTNQAGINQMREILSPSGVEVIEAPLPYGMGPSACLHLMSLMSLLDEKTILVDLPWLAVETVAILQSRGYSFVEIDYAERDTLACNVLSLGTKRLLAIEENVKTNDKLRAAGFDVRTFPASELGINGGGGPTCLTRPLLRG